MNIILTQSTNREILLELGRRLKAYRLQQNVSVEELATRAGLSRTTVSNAESGRNPTLETIVRLLRGLRKLDALDAFLSPPMISPIQLLEGRTRRPRKHAYPAKRGSRE